MRTIDADALFQTFEEHGWYNNADRDEIAERLLLEQPTLDTVPVIRCRDCKYWTADDEERTMFCGEEILPTTVACMGNGYCSVAERKEK